MHEIENKQWLTLTSEEDWNPHDESFTENERKAREKKAILWPLRALCMLIR